jgi:hypothetical protein
MRHITTEQASKFISIEEDGYTHMEPHYFTSTDDSEGWSKITYYTNKPKREFAGQHGEQFVYVLTNKYMPGIVKIGFTSLNPYDRAHIISQHTGIPDEFSMDFAFRCVDGKKLEGMVHKSLHEYRIKKRREFFKMEVNDAISTIVSIGSNC